MALQLRTLALDHASPAPPTLTKGARLAAGVSAPKLQTIGVLTGGSALDGSFNDSSGVGGIDYDAQGRLYVGDNTNNRWQRFARDGAGLWVFDSKVLAVNALGSGLAGTVLAIDRSRSEVHLASHNQYVDGTWVGVWSINDWPNLTVGNRVRSYGSNSLTPAAGKAVFCYELSIDPTYAVATSVISDFRVLRWNHMTGALDTQEVQSARYNRIIHNDGGKWFGGAPSGGAESGVHELLFTAPGTLASVVRIDGGAGYAGSNIRRGRFRTGAEYGNVAYFGGRLYVRESLFGRMMGWDAVNYAYLDTFLPPKEASATEQFGWAPGYFNGSASAKFGFVGGTALQPDEMVLWSSHADNVAVQSFLSTIPMSVATATWSYSNWTALGPSTLKGLPFAGQAIDSARGRVEYRKTPSGGAAGAWKLVPWDKLLDAAYIAGLGDHVFNAGDLLEVRLSMSIWDRLDGHASLIAVGGGPAPENVTGVILYEETVTAITVPKPTIDLGVGISTPPALGVGISV